MNKIKCNYNQYLNKVKITNNITNIVNNDDLCVALIRSEVPGAFRSDVSDL